MKKIKATIEKGADGGYGIYAEGGIPLFAGGATEDEAKADFEAMVPEQAEHIRERTGSYPDWYAPGVEVEYSYDISAFFLAFPFISASGLARSIGLNPSLMRKYKSGLAKASQAQKDIIQRKLDDIVARLVAVRF